MHLHIIKDIDIRTNTWTCTWHFLSPPYHKHFHSIIYPLPYLTLKNNHLYPLSNHFSSKNVLHNLYRTVSLTCWFFVQVNEEIQQWSGMDNGARVQLQALVSDGHVHVRNDVWCQERRRGGPGKTERTVISTWNSTTCKTYSCNFFFNGC